MHFGAVNQWQRTKSVQAGGEAETAVAAITCTKQTKKVLVYLKWTPAQKEIFPEQFQETKECVSSPLYIVDNSSYFSWILQYHVRKCTGLNSTLA